MRCPNCDQLELSPVLTRQGVEVDYCRGCRGVWLDKGGIYLFSPTPRRIAQQLGRALRSAGGTSRRSPRNGRPMVAIPFPGGVQAGMCKQSGGLWFDAAGLEGLVAGGVRLDIDEPTLTASGAMPGQTVAAARISPRGDGTVLPVLFASAGALALWSLLVAAAAYWSGLARRDTVLLGGAGIVLLLLAAPVLMDVVLRALFGSRRVPTAGLPAHLRDFLAGPCAQRGLRTPRFGVIEDAAPQLLAYGHGARNARVVFTTGLLQVLGPAELEAVVARELGQARGFEFPLVTALQLPAVLLRACYRLFMDRGGYGGQRRRQLLWIAVGAYLLLGAGEYTTRWLCRARVLRADRFAAEMTGRPEALANALGKVAFGLAGVALSGASESRTQAAVRAGERNVEPAEDPAAAQPGRRLGAGEGEAAPRRAILEAVGALGIFHPEWARALAVAGYQEARAERGERDSPPLKAALRWETWNPWARWYELHATHPLLSRRLLHLGRDAGWSPPFPASGFEGTRPTSYWDGFPRDLGIHLLPVLAPLVAAGGLALLAATGASIDIELLLRSLLAAFGAGLFARFRFVYRGGYFPYMSVAALLKKVRVSSVRPVLCKVRGTIVGRGVPGAVTCRDFVLRDDTGIIFLDYRRPLAIWELFFGLAREGDFEGRSVLVEGWYRRSPVPRIELRTLICGGNVSTSRAPLLYLLTSAALVLAALLWI